MIVASLLLQPVLPGNYLDGKLFQGLVVAAVSNPGFTPAEEGGDADCLLDLVDFCV